MTTENIDDRISRMEGALPYLATKADVESLRADMIAGDAALQSEIAALRTDMIAGDAALRTDIYRMEARLVKCPPTHHPAPPTRHSSHPPHQPTPHPHHAII